MSAAGNLRTLARDVQTFGRDYPRAGAEVAQRVVEQAVRRETGDGRLRNLDAGAATVTVRAGQGVADVEASGSMAVWAILESGTSAHAIRGRGAGRSAVVRTPAGPRRAVQVRGVRARHTFTRAAERALDAVVDDAGRAWSQAVG